MPYNSKFEITELASVSPVNNNTMKIEIEMSDGEAMDAVREIFSNMGNKDRDSLLGELASQLIDAAHDAGFKEGEQQH